MAVTFTLILSLCLPVSFCETSKPLVETRLGLIQGHHKVSYEGKNFAAFEGIPYAIPPIGVRRFEEPEPIEAWDGVWQATFLHECVQLVTNDTQYVPDGIQVQGDEDCLYLNVYVPRDHPDPKEKLDVIVHIHGGGFMFGSGHFYAYPEYLMDHDVIFITFNYRLGVFGFLSTQDKVIPGNFGLKDQVVALKWIQDNIASFGGNPASVTLTGMSAGAASVHLHYLSPMSKGLFHRGCSQSGSVLNPWAIQLEPETKARKLAQILDCPSNTSQLLLKCLKQRTYHQILNLSVQLYQYKYEPIVMFAPVVEKGTNAFLEDEPYKLMKEGKVLDVPWIISTVSHEGKFFASQVFNDNITEINADWNKYFPSMLYYNYISPRHSLEELGNKIKNFYLGENQDVTEKNFENLVKIYTDRIFTAGATEAAILQSNVTASPVYYYYFGYANGPNRFVSHGQDGQYLFYYATATKPSEGALKMKDIMMELLVSYAKNGQPSIDSVVWEPTKGDELTFLNISSTSREDLNLKKVKGLASEDFWKSLENINV